MLREMGRSSLRGKTAVAWTAMEKEIDSQTLSFPLF